METGIVKASEIKQADITNFIEIAKQLAITGYFLDEDRSLDPQKLQARAFARIMAGHELGIGPMASMQNVHIIKGKTSLGYSLVGGLIRRHPLYDYDVTEHSKTTCTIEFYRIEGQEKKLMGEPITWTIEMAKRADLVKPNSGWVKHPEDYLFARAMTAGARRYCPDVFMGAIYTPEELQQEETEDAAFTIITEEPFTEEERKTFHAIGSFLYADDWDNKRHVLVSAITEGRTESSSDLTRSEMQRLIAGMNEQKAKQTPQMIGETEDLQPKTA